MTILDQLETISKQLKMDFPTGIIAVALYEFVRKLFMSPVMMLHGCKIMHIKKLM